MKITTAISVTNILLSFDREQLEEEQEETMIDTQLISKWSFQAYNYLVMSFLF
jgi:hypothetical protein